MPPAVCSHVGHTGQYPPLIRSSSGFSVSFCGFYWCIRHTSHLEMCLWPCRARTGTLLLDDNPPPQCECRGTCHHISMQCDRHTTSYPLNTSCSCCRREGGYWELFTCWLASPDGWSCEALQGWDHWQRHAGTAALSAGSVRVEVWPMSAH